jgi:hypothetical protein
MKMLCLFLVCSSHVHVSVSLQQAPFLNPLKRLLPFFDETATQELSRDRKNRIYANSTKLRQLSGPVYRDRFVTLPDAFQTTRDSAWITAPYRLSVLAAAYTVFPTLIDGLRMVLQDVGSEGDATAVTTGFAPAISLLYGAWLGLTFNILQERIGQLQRTATQESSFFCALCERTSLLTEQAPLDIVEAVFEPLFEHTAALANRSREEELLLITNDDVYLRYRRSLKLLAACETHQAMAVTSEITSCNDLTDKLMLIRADRLSMETRSLPAAHFAILSLFSIQLLTCFVYAIAQSAVASDDPPLRIAFAFFAGVYLLVFNFAADLNDPFRGIYQIRRSAINANLIASRVLIASVVGEATVAGWRDGEEKRKARFDLPSMVEMYGDSYEV